MKKVVFIDDDDEQPDMYVGTFEVPDNFNAKEQRKAYHVFRRAQSAARKAWRDIPSMMREPGDSCPIPYLDFAGWLMAQGIVRKVEIDVIDVGD